MVVASVTAAGGNGFLICKQNGHLITVIPILCYRCRFKLPIFLRSAVYLCSYPAEFWQLNRVITDFDIPVCDICCIGFFRLKSGHIHLPDGRWHWLRQICPLLSRKDAPFLNAGYSMYSHLF